MPCTLRELANLLNGTGVRLVLNGKCPNNYLIQVEEHDHVTGGRVWVTGGGYRYAEQFFGCGTAAYYVRWASEGCDGDQSAKLTAIADAMDEICDARMRREKIGKYAEAK